ncbi:MAG TPA: hypothetical protein VHP33_41270 [Polyangiaceae bacterium]|nr:hypothetical protein [Polyangiaceae bacterium]
MPSSGTLRVDYPGYSDRAPLSLVWAGKETWPKQFPAELQVPLSTEVTVWVGRQNGSFSKKLTLTAAAPSASVFVPTFEPPALGLFGFKRSELPEPTSFERVTERALPPALLAFQLGSWQHGDGASLFGIDLSGNVVKVRESASGVEHVALGRVAPELLAAKLAAARRAPARGLQQMAPSCHDCGSATISVASTDGDGAERLVLAIDGEQLKRVRLAEGLEALSWFLAVATATGQRFWGTY